MSVTYTAIRQLAPTVIEVAWSSDLEDPTFYVYRDGTLIATTKQTRMRFTVAPGEQLMLEVLDTTAEPTEAFPPHLDLHWRAAADTDHYRIDEYVAAVWTERGRVRDTGRPYYTWRTRALEDVTTHTFRIMPVGTNGNDGSAVTIACMMVRHPDEPTATWLYNSGTRKVTITIT